MSVMQDQTHQMQHLVGPLPPSPPQRFCLLAPFHLWWETVKRPVLCKTTCAPLRILCDSAGDMLREDRNYTLKELQIYYKYTTNIRQHLLIGAGRNPRGCLKKGARKQDWIEKNFLIGSTPRDTECNALVRISGVGQLVTSLAPRNMEKVLESPNLYFLAYTNRRKKDGQPRGWGQLPQ